MGNEVKVGAGAARPVRVEEMGADTWRVWLGEVAHVVHGHDVGAGLLHLQIGDRVAEVGLERREEGWVARIEGRPVVVEIGDPRRRLLSRHGAAGGGPKDITSPMPGKVIKVLVNPGDQVTAGQGLVVVEAMKMENEYKAPNAGRIGKVFVENGQTIEAGAKLLRIEPVPAVEA